MLGVGREEWLKLEEENGGVLNDYYSMKGNTGSRVVAFVMASIANVVVDLWCGQGTKK